MKYVIALVSAAGVIFFWAVLSVAVGWQRGGGIIGMLFMWAVVAGVWSAVMARFPDGPTNTPPLTPAGSDGDNLTHQGDMQSMQHKYSALKKLNSLKLSNILTDAEYEAEKKKILNKE